MKLIKDIYWLDIDFYHREGFSDLKTFEEVIGRKAYLKRWHDFKIIPGERWMDCGGNVGAFTHFLAAQQLGAERHCLRT